MVRKPSKKRLKEMTTTMCDYSDLPVVSCHHCVGDQALQPQDRRHAAGRSTVRGEGWAFPAHEQQACAAGCGILIQEGDVICRSPDGYIHEDCA